MNAKAQSVEEIVRDSFRAELAARVEPGDPGEHTLLPARTRRMRRRSSLPSLHPPPSIGPTERSIIIAVKADRIGIDSNRIDPLRFASTLTGISTERRGGRTRSPEAQHAVLTELLEEYGYQALTIEKIAERSGVTKSMIYRWWRSRPELVMDAYTHVVAQRMPEPDTGTVYSDLTEFVTQLYRVTEHPLRVRALYGLMAEAQLAPDFRDPFRTWVNSRRAVVADLLGRGVQRGELRADLDIGHTVDLIFGPFLYRLLVGDEPLHRRTRPCTYPTCSTARDPLHNHQCFCRRQSHVSRLYPRNHPGFERSMGQAQVT